MVTHSTKRSPFDVFETLDFSQVFKKLSLYHSGMTSVNVDISAPVVRFNYSVEFVCEHNLGHFAGCVSKCLIVEIFQVDILKSEKIISIRLINEKCKAR